MNFLQAIILGIVQGAAEFLPISSKGHLVIVKHLLGAAAGEHGPVMEVVAHLGTLLAVVVFFYRQLWDLASYGLVRGWAATARSGPRAAWWEAPEGRMILCIGVGTVVTGAIGATFQDRAEATYGSLHLTGAGLIFTSAVLGLAWLVRHKGNRAELSLWIALGVGLMQSVAILPGVSRSGMTIVAALLLGLRRERAFEFSFLVSIPIILGATLLELHKYGLGSAFQTPAPAFVLVAAAFVSGALALWVLRPVVSKGNIGAFALYCLPVGLFALLAL
ncbi:MAG: undecaprenyl-diphosphate phosphatase [Candidatus Sumerlaeota bacterium]|nr:undecaprenyl-diphosphate phosphatase [Candidatus Sumerlaeota bacterium]